MDTSSIAALATSMSQAALNQQVGVAVLKKALAVQQQSALALLAALPSPPAASNLPPHLGQNINVTA
ncbi:MAG: putative motility protein [Burkholderiaceae bacterium]|nr:MAG: putative motility protein [Burkholderiaceae bacterium]